MRGAVVTSKHLAESILHLQDSRYIKSKHTFQLSFKLPLINNFL